MSSLWLDTQLSEEALLEIAQVVQESGLGRAELEDVFRYELAPFLGKNQTILAGEWEAFDPEWVCREAGKRRGKRGLFERLMAHLGLSTYAARPAWDKVLAYAFNEPAP